MRTLKLARYTLVLVAVFLFLNQSNGVLAAPLTYDGWCADDCGPSTPCDLACLGPGEFPIMQVCGNYEGGADSAECDDACADICGQSVECSTACDHVISDPKTCGDYDGGVSNSWCNPCGDGICDFANGETVCNCGEDCGDGVHGCEYINPDLGGDGVAWCISNCSAYTDCNGYGICRLIGDTYCVDHWDCAVGEICMLTDGYYATGHCVVAGAMTEPR